MPPPRISPECRRIGDYLPCPLTEIERGLSAQAAESAFGNFKRIGEILVEREQISQEELKDALEFQRIDHLRRCAFFASVSDTDLVEIGEQAVEVSLSTGEMLMRQDHRGDSIYLVTSGRVLMYRRNEILEAVPVGVAVPGDVLGEMDYTFHGTRSFSACAIEPVRLLKMRYDDLFSRTEILSNPAVDLHEALSKRCVEEPSRSYFSGLSDKLAGTDLSTGIDALIDVIVERACQVLNADRAYLFLADPQTGDLRCNVTNGRERREIRVRSRGEIVGWVAQTGQLVNVPDAYLDPGFNPEIDFLTGYRSRTLLAGAVRNSQGEIIAVVQVVNKLEGRFDGEDEMLFRAFAQQSIGALENCRQALIDKGP